MTRLYGRSERGARCLCAEPHGHWQSATFIAALRSDRLCAPLLLDGPMDGAMFLAYLREVLAPELGEGDIVIIAQEGWSASTAATGRPGAAIDSAIVGVVDYVDLLAAEK